MAGAGYNLFTAGQILTAAQVNTYLNQQTVMVFASAAARNAALASVLSEGQVAYLLDLNVLTVYSGAAWSTVGPIHGAWTAYTPTWSGTLGNGTLTGAYQRLGRTVVYRAKVLWGTTTSHAAANQSITLPVAAHADYATNAGLGNSSCVQPGTNSWHGTPIWASSTSVNIVGGVSVAGAGAGLVTNLVPMTWANLHVLYVSGTYEAAADA